MLTSGKKFTKQEVHIVLVAESDLFFTRFALIAHENLDAKESEQACSSRLHLKPAKIKF